MEHYERLAKSESRICDNNVKLFINAKEQLTLHSHLWYYHTNKHGNKLRTYTFHNELLVPEHYLCTILHRYKCRVLSKLICGTQPFDIESGRYNKITLEERKCIVCQKKIYRIWNSLFSWMFFVWWPQKWCFNQIKHSDPD